MKGEGGEGGLLAMSELKQSQPEGDITVDTNLTVGGLIGHGHNGGGGGRRRDFLPCLN